MNSIAKNYIIFNNLVRAFLDYLKKQYSNHAQEFQVFETYFRLISNQMSFPLRNYRAITTPFYTEILAKNERYFLEYSTEGLFESVHLKEIYIQANEAEKEVLWDYIIKLTKLAHD